MHLAIQIEKDVNEYATFNEFFARKLKPGTRACLCQRTAILLARACVRAPPSDSTRACLCQRTAIPVFCLCQRTAIRFDGCSDPN